MGLKTTSGQYLVARIFRLKPVDNDNNQPHLNSRGSAVTPITSHIGLIIAAVFPIEAFSPSLAKKKQAPRGLE
jgi:hypothetical protein